MPARVCSVLARRPITSHTLHLIKNKNIPLEECKSREKARGR